jgi:hypothetical protein
VKEFKEDFNFCQVISFIKNVLFNGSNSLKKQFDRCLLAIYFLQRKLRAFTREILDTDISEFKLLSDDEVEIFTNLKSTHY